MPGRLPLSIAAVLFGVFLALGHAVHTGATADFDLRSSLDVQSDDETTQAVAVAISRPLDTWRGFVAAFLVLAGVWGAWQRRAALFTLAGGGGAVLASHIAKLLYGRARPSAPIEVMVEQPVTSSFPSGHVSWVAGFVGAVIWLAMRNKSWGTRTWQLAIYVVCVGAMAWSRVYLGQHFVTDVVGGTLLGLMCVAIAIATVRPDSGPA